LGKTCHLIENPLEGQLDTGKLIEALWKYCASLGVHVHTGCEVQKVYEEDNEVVAECNGAVFKAHQMAICTNAFTNILLQSHLDVAPGRGVVMSIIPEKPLQLEGTFHYEEGYYYFRDYYGRLLFGGGRNLAKEEETTTDFGINEKVKRKLINDLETIIIPNQTYKIEMEWSGIMAFGETKAPIVKHLSDKMVLGVRLGGMGVAIGSIVGEEVAELILKNQASNFT